MAVLKIIKEISTRKRWYEQKHVPSHIPTKLLMLMKERKMSVEGWRKKISVENEQDFIQIIFGVFKHHR
ncbi:Protein CBG26718 [Caenorhabditis briggsae]|uniref:Protein CBG26718 n=1 Tax=Caenorhabditis briggsae TaxID=6238 RepID=B6IE90_CAEBR|nr:Protein CBG26718 [Caenorhabditis briggsae]CAS01154.1 Protein CBG26718 [Caenorhabditis briggsae]